MLCIVRVQSVHTSKSFKQDVYSFWTSDLIFLMYFYISYVIVTNNNQQIVYFESKLVKRVYTTVNSRADPRTLRSRITKISSITFTMSGIESRTSAIHGFGVLGLALHTTETVKGIKLFLFLSIN